MDTLFRAKRKDTKEWIYWNVFGQIVCDDGKTFNFVTYFGVNYWYIIDLIPILIPETVGQYTGLGDVWEHDIVEIWGKRFKVVKECGAFGIISWEDIDYELFNGKIKEYTGCDNNPCFCYNDNFISLWELYWNYNEEENNLFCVNVIGNIHDNPELLKGETE